MATFSGARLSYSWSVSHIDRRSGRWLKDPFQRDGGSLGLVQVYVPLASHMDASAKGGKRRRMRAKRLITQRCHHPPEDGDARGS